MPGGVKKRHRSHSRDRNRTCITGFDSFCLSSPCGHYSTAPHWLQIRSLGTIVPHDRHSTISMAPCRLHVVQRLVDGSSGRPQSLQIRFRSAVVRTGGRKAVIKTTGGKRKHRTPHKIWERPLRAANMPPITPATREKINALDMIRRCHYFGGTNNRFRVQ